MLKVLIGILTTVVFWGCSPRANTLKEPQCIQNLVKKFESEPVTNPPLKIVKYQYNKKVVYYVPAICCDQFSSLYDEDCNLLGHPDGGYTGRGDGKFPDFETEALYKETVWQDSRKKNNN